MSDLNGIEVNGTGRSLTKKSLGEREMSDLSDLSDLWQDLIQTGLEVAKSHTIGPPAQRITPPIAL